MATKKKAAKKATKKKVVKKAAAKKTTKKATKKKATRKKKQYKALTGSSPWETGGFFFAFIIGLGPTNFSLIPL